MFVILLRGVVTCDTSTVQVQPINRCPNQDDFPTTAEYCYRQDEASPPPSVSESKPLNKSLLVKQLRIKQWLERFNHHSTTTSEMPYTAHSPTSDRNCTHPRSAPAAACAPSTSAPTAYGVNADKTGIYFKHTLINFGSSAVGTLTRTRIELCNATDREVIVYIGDPTLPFVLLHNEVKIRPRCYVRLPVRFVPILGPRQFTTQLTAQSADGLYHTMITLTGASH